VSHAEAGSQLPDIYFWEIADRIVGANGALIARYNQLIKAKAVHLAEQQAERRARAKATALQLTAAPSPGSGQTPPGFCEVHPKHHMCEDQICEQRCAHTSHEVPFDPMKRRTLLRWGLGVTAGNSLGRVPSGQLEAVDGQHPFAPRGESEATPGLDIDPVEHLQQMKKVLMDNDNIFGANSVILSVREQIGNLQRLRQGYRGVDRNKLLQLQIQFADLCGWLYQDSGDYRAAAYWSGRALEWAHMCGDQDAVAFILARRSQLAGDMEDGAEALDAAEAALNLAPQGAIRIGAVAMTYAAHGHALRRDVTNCERSYAMAQSLAGQLKPDPTSPWALFLDNSYIEVQRARSLTLFGEYETAVESFQRAISCLPRGYRRDRGVYLARQAVAHLGDNDLEQACAVGLRALEIGVETRSSRIIHELKYFDAALKKFSTTSVAADFHDAMNWAFLR
jgi:tetratricopeptide (TPR) repeat protein